MYKQSYSYSFLYSFEVSMRFKFGVLYAMIVINSRQIKMREYEMITFALLLLKLLLKINAVGFQLYDIFLLASHTYRLCHLYLLNVLSYVIPKAHCSAMPAIYFYMKYYCHFVQSNAP